MTFYTNIGYNFKVDASLCPSGSVVVASGMPSHQLTRRFRKKMATPRHLKVKLFDPQLYLAILDPIENTKTCVNLASYPWFLTQNIRKYDSGQIAQKDWKKQTHQHICSSWRQSAPQAPDIVPCVRACIDFQVRLGVDGIILPAPLTTDFSSSYADELEWLDAGIRHIENAGIKLPVYWTIAVSDACTRPVPPASNQLLQMIADSVSARGIRNVYLVFEQASAPDSARHSADTRSLEATLEFVHVLSRDCGISVGVNFFGVFGSVVHAISDGFWATNWYKSQYRLRLSDPVGRGRAFPSYWSQLVGGDIHLAKDLDAIVKVPGLLESIADRTSESAPLVLSLGRGKQVNAVNAWRHTQGNVSTAKSHFVSSLTAFDAAMCRGNRLDFVRSWLDAAVGHVQVIERRVPKLDSSLDHVKAWQRALDNFCRRHNL